MVGNRSGLAARYAGYMLTAAAVLTAALAATLPLGIPGPRPGVRDISFAICAVAFVFGVLLLWWGRRVPRYVLYTAPLVAAVLTCTPTVATRADTPTGTILLVWPVLYAAYMLPKAVARLTLVVAVGVFGGVVLTSASYQALMLFIEVAVSLVLTYYVNRALRGRVDRLVGSLHDQAHTDILTGLANRRLFDADLERAVAQYDRIGTPLAVVLLDIDYFKRINDVSGHDAGDAALRRLADLMLGIVRHGDVCARIGGEEFAILLPGTTLAGGLDLAERVYAGLDGAAVDWPDPLTVSMGVAAVPDNATDAEAVVRAADRALYAAKSSGRNTIRVAGD